MERAETRLEFRENRIGFQIVIKHDVFERKIINVNLGSFIFSSLRGEGSVAERPGEGKG